MRRTVLVVGLACACVRAPGQEQTVQTLEFPGQKPEAESRPKAALLSAHFAVNDAAAFGGADALPLVFSVEVDASTVVAQHFVVAREDGTRARATHALLSPANEDDENRTVLLLGDFGAPDDRPATSVAVTGPLYAENGDSLQGLATTVLAYDAPPTVVLAVRLASAPGRCSAAKALARTYWTEGLRGLAPESLTRMTVRLADGTTTQPVAFDDQGLPGQDAADDNVLDLCVDTDGEIVGVRIEAGVLTDPAGHPNAAIDVDVEVARG